MSIGYIDLGSLTIVSSGKAGNMIHYVYATRGGYLYLVGKYSHVPKVEKSGEFVLSVPDKTSQSQLDTLAHQRFVEHLKRPRRIAHTRHAAGARELATV
ncbi:MAG: hypothetical protein P4L53_11420 [Candidatus Obscuribacterales bacterium]|nr:hypothetical protein [Candidatus Obscuribacterales bacterium]